MVVVASDSVRMRVFPASEAEREAAIAYIQIAQVLPLPVAVVEMPAVFVLTPERTQHALLNWAVARNIERLLRAGFVTSHPFDDDLVGTSLNHVLAWALIGADMVWTLEDDGRYVNMNGEWLYDYHPEIMLYHVDGRFAADSPSVDFPDTDEAAMDAFCRRVNWAYQ